MRALVSFLSGAFIVAAFLLLPLPWAFVAALILLVSFLWAVLLGMNDYLGKLERVLAAEGPTDPDEFDLDYLADPAVGRWTSRFPGEHNGDE